MKSAKPSSSASNQPGWSHPWWHAEGQVLELAVAVGDAHTAVCRNLLSADIPFEVVVDINTVFGAIAILGQHGHAVGHTPVLYLLGHGGVAGEAGSRAFGEKCGRAGSRAA